MSREIKFRAWHDEFGEMVYSDGEMFHGKREFSPFVFSVGFSHYPDPSEWKIMQFTGFKDKNGTDIYEGDILKITWADIYKSNNSKRCTVKFDNGYSFHCPQSGAHTMNQKIEIVGNIYQKKKKNEKS